MTSENIVLSMEHITKTFGGVPAISDVSFQLREGEVHALIGANGAGKSTLMKVLNGIYTGYAGDVIIDGRKVDYKNPIDAQKAGIAMIHQELDMVAPMTVYSNIYLGREPIKHGHVDFEKMQKDAQTLLDSLGFNVQASAIVGELPPAQQQLVLIARCVALDARIVVMDEPTSSLSFKETEELFKVISDLTKRGKSVIYISHFLEEVFRVSDRITVLRNGKNVVTAETSNCTVQKLVYWMVGTLESFEKKFVRESHYDEICLEVKNFTQHHGGVENVNFKLRKGEILGIAGVVGTGRTELAKMIIGAERKKSGALLMDGKPLNVSDPSVAVKNGIALVPEDRKHEGLIAKRSIGDNISVSALKRYTKAGVIHYGSAHADVAKMIDYMHIICTGHDHIVTALSGGNQQKVVMGRWLNVRPKVLILDQPTRGVDVGAKAEIYELINQLAEEGTSILLITDEMEELLNLCDRLLVMRRGKIINEFNNGSRTLTKAELLQAMVG